MKENRWIMTVPEASEVLCIDAQTIREGIDNGSFPFGMVFKSRSGKKVYKISRQRVNEFLGVSENE